MIAKELLEDLYLKQGKSKQDIASRLGCSLHKVSYWMDKHLIMARSISDAIYLKHNPDGDPFKFRKPKTLKEAELFGLGIGLYWGEGTKADKNTVRLGNTDAKLIKKFIEFLVVFFSIRKEDLRFGVQIFTDIDIEEAVNFWKKELRIAPKQFYKPIVTISGSIGTYKKRSKYGVLTVYYHNIKMRDAMNELMPV